MQLIDVSLRIALSRWLAAWNAITLLAGPDSLVEFWLSAVRQRVEVKRVRNKGCFEDELNRGALCTL